MHAKQRRVEIKHRKKKAKFRAERQAERETVAAARPAARR